ncbi:MAG: Ribose-phosphate pyrophosphokinase [Parcubacteria group bacterium GW2011_GWC2_39_14]|nr:MAG: Ribose-phosphate pyrophosphokinase [Parcubacteria group bacterium GW2011_GWC2_39_14]KKR54500.1 MAG: Ribose-phosphate pyrophosphokinase [Parcubacteria group bacterium GW2011_GWA2_40_23]
MADFMLFAGNSHLEFARGIARCLNVPLHEPDEKGDRGPMIKWFSNGNVLVDVKCDVRGKQVFVIQTQAPGRALIGKNTDGTDIFGTALSVSDMIMELYWLVDTLTCAGASVRVVMPYMPYIRSDKMDHPRSSIGARIFADLLTAAGACGLLILEPHFQQIHGFFDRKKIKVDTLNMKPIFGYEILATTDRTRTVFVAPDIGEAKHLGPFVSMLGFPIAIINKDRAEDNETAQAQQLVGNVEGRDCVVIDDETMSCGTLIEAADFCQANGARSLRAAIAHPVLTSLDGLRKVQAHPLITELQVLDGIPISAEKLSICPKLRVHSVTREVAHAISILAAPPGEGHSLEAYKQSLYDPLNDLLARTK